MANICIPKDIADDIVKNLKPSMSSEERRAILEKYLGDKITAKEVNKKFEATLLLKAQQNAVEDRLTTEAGKKFAFKVTDNKGREKMLERMLTDKQRKFDAVRNPDGTIKDNFKDLMKVSDEDIEQMANEFYTKKYNVDIPEKITVNGVEVDTTQHLLKLQDEATLLEQAASGAVDFSPEKIAWGRKLVEIQEVLEDIQHGQKSYKEAIKESLGVIRDRAIKTSEEFKAGNIARGVGEGFNTVGQTVGSLLDLTFSPAVKSIKASLDNSVLFRQGLKVLSANPKIWGKNANITKEVWKRSFDAGKMKELSRDFKAGMMTRELYREAIDSGLAIGVMEDFFPDSFATKIPGLKNFFQASDDAFTMFSQGSRMDLFESYVKLFDDANPKPPTSDNVATEAYKKLREETLKQFSKLANSTTGRGGLGSLEAASGFLNKVLFSARYQTANINTIRHAFTLQGEAGRIAQRQLARHLAVVGGIMTTFSALGDVGFDPRQSNFGKVRLPGTKKWIDITGGLGSYLSFLGRMGNKMGDTPKYGQESAYDILLNFMSGKLAPVPGAIRDYLEGRTYGGEKPNLETTLRSIFAPIGLDNLAKGIEKDGLTDEDIYALLIEFIGGGVSEPKKQPKPTWEPEDLLK